jgi:hypothetical protein
LEHNAKTFGAINSKYVNNDIVEF